MARARNIKPGFYKNEDLAECSIWARFIFPGLWMLADREGRMEDRPKRMKAELLPFDGADMDVLLTELHDRGFIHRYVNSEGRFIQIMKFSEHQSPHYSEKSSVIKPPPLPEFSECQQCIEGAENREHSKNDPGMMDGSQPPDILIPDSLIPESLKQPTRSGSKKPPPLAIPEWIPREQWDAWLEARTKLKKPPTDFAKRLAISKLNDLREAGHHPAAVLAQSAFNGWSGLFPVKEQRHG